MSDELLCVCGHQEEQHHPDKGVCRCLLFRPVLPWPDAEGCWWFACDDPDFEPQRGLLRFWMSPHYGLVALCDDGDITDFDTWPLHHGTASFTRLLEQNPFGEPQ